MEQQLRPLGIYIHIPFCRSKCEYCDFYSLPGAKNKKRIEDYTQALLFVSHDRYFIEKFATRIWLLENGTITDYRGTYAQFREYRARQTALQQTAKAVERKKEPKPKPKRAPNTTRQRERTEREIEKLEGQLAALDAESEANATDYQKLMELDAQKQALNAQLEALYEAWEALCE